VGEDGGLIAGHARVLAARQLGIVEIPVMVAAGWTEAQKRAYVLADNQLAITGSGWDPELLRLNFIRVDPGIFRVWDQPIDRPPLDLVRRPRPLISVAISRAGARPAREGKCWRFYDPADPLQAALRLAPLIIPMFDLIQSACGYSKRPPRAIAETLAAGQTAENAAWVRRTAKVGTC